MGRLSINVFIGLSVVHFESLSERSIKTSERVIRFSERFARTLRWYAEVLEAFSKGAEESKGTDGHFECLNDREAS